MTRSSRSRTLLAAVCLVLAAGCSPLPADGPVEVVEAPAPSASAAPFDFNPPGPVAGASRGEVVAGFLRALQATPVGTVAADEFLTAVAADRWRPELRTIVYDGQDVAVRAGGVDVRLDAAFELDRTGRWAGTGSGSPAGGPEPLLQTTGRTLHFDLVRREGEWRIDRLPDAMIIPQPHFEARYREYALPFFDPTGSVLVLEPVYLPWGVQAPTALVTALLSGPSAAGAEVERTFFPPSTRLGVSVPVRENGVAEVPLSRQVLDLSKDQLDLAMAQLAWTLRQVSEVKSFQVTVDGSAIELPGADQVVDVDHWAEDAPWVASASTDLFGVRGDAIVQVVDEAELDASVLPPGLEHPRSMGVDLSGQQFALVSGDGHRVLQLSRTGNRVRRPVHVYDGTDVLRPMWDHTGRLWLLDRTAEAGATLLVAHFGRVIPVPSPGLEGSRVLAAALSRDGTRLVALLAGKPDEGDRLVLMRVVRRTSGAPVRLTRPVPLAAPEPLLRGTDLAWRDPTRVAVLTRPSRTTSEVVLASVDGSSGSVGLDSSVDVLFEPGTALAASPAIPLSLVVATRSGAVHALDLQGRWDLDAVGSGLRLPAFVG